VPDAAGCSPAGEDAAPVIMAPTPRSNGGPGAKPPFFFFYPGWGGEGRYA